MAEPRNEERWPGALWGLWTWLVFVPVLAVSTSVLGSLAWLLAPVSPAGSFWCMRTWGRILCRANFVRVQVEGLEHVRPGRAYVIMSNHQSYFDVLALCARWPAQFRWVIKQELRKVPFIGSATARMGCIFVDRKNRERAVASLRAAAPLFERGVSLLIFPEGTRRRDGRLGELKKGGFMVALDAGLPVLPVSMSGAYRVLRPETLRLRPGTIRLQVHPPLDTKSYGLEGRDRLMADVRAALAAGLAPHERGEADAGAQAEASPPQPPPDALPVG